MISEQQPGAIDGEHLRLQMLEAQILRELASQERGEETASMIPKDALESDLKKMQFMIKVKEYIFSFPPDEQQEVVNKIAQNGFPPELFATVDNFVIEGNDTMH